MVSWMNCGSCACNVIPREAAYEVSDEPKSESVTSVEKKTEPEKTHLKDNARRQEYEGEWKSLKKHSIKLPRVSFEKFFEEKGHLER